MVRWLSWLVYQLTAIALALTAFAVLLVASGALSRVANRGGIPLVLLFMLVGMAAGTEGLGGIHFDDHTIAFRIGTVALVLILFDGGASTRLAAVRRHLSPALVLATVGVVATAMLLAGFVRLFGLSWTESLLLGSIVSSTDAAAVFSVLRGSGVHLSRRVGATIELESGLNDPMAVILTVALAASLAGGGAIGASLVWRVPVQLAVGAAIGIAAALAAYALITRFPPATASLIPVLTVALACLAFGTASLAGGSGFLAVYVAGLVIGSRRVPNQGAIVRVHDFLAWFSQVVMFLAFGLLVFPSQLIGQAGMGIAIALFLAVVARPLVVAACLFPFGYPAREVLFIGWVGLRGAVPIILGAFPVLLGVPAGKQIFHLVFFVVVVSVALQGATVRWLARKLELEEKAPPPPPAALEINSRQPISVDLNCYYLTTRAAVVGSTLAEIPLPPDAAVVLVGRGREILPARGRTRMQVGDHVYVLCSPGDEAVVTLLFGQKVEA